MTIPDTEKTFEILKVETLPLEDHPYFYDFRKLHSETFGEEYTQSVLNKLRSKERVLLLLAIQGQKFLGFKLGYEKSSHLYYSWTGVVDTPYRKMGVATAMLLEQHEWCRRHGYQKIRTKTKNQWRDMLILNVRNGFDIIGSYTDDHGTPKLILEKKL